MHIKDWVQTRIRQDEIDRYKEESEKDFIDDELIESCLDGMREPDVAYVRQIIAKSLRIETLSLRETAALLYVKDPVLIAEMEEAAIRIKKFVYDNRIVTFAPLYLSSKCVNSCRYCSFRAENGEMERRIVPRDELKKEVQTLAGEIGHKRLIVVYGEHPDSDIGYIVDTVKEIYGSHFTTRKGSGQIRRVNINAAPMSIGDLKRLKEVGIGTYQVFQETYHKKTYRQVHPQNTLKGNYDWRLYTMHRAFDAGIDDVGIGALFGLYDWRFEVMGLISHTHELERRFGVGPHTISFPRLEPASNAPLATESKYLVNDEDFKHAVLTLRLAVPYTGMILTAREDAPLRRRILPLGITQTDASTKIGLGAYSRDSQEQDFKRQQFVIGDSRSLDEVVRDMAEMGFITSFCTAGYRCGRTGNKIMDMLKCGTEGKFCKLNAIITYREWLDDFASEETRRTAEPLIQKEIREVREQNPDMFDMLMAYYEKTAQGSRDLYF
ncbi:[FeFe] hydrogenase H-cluster radical SAM maturase HydG [Pleomorphochaeta sp. DL1XJH-081]|jgi:2-iminoacetate synthase|uniref:[FeFe] hydrogenase H-cluster radical SAM maturase HydG n=1 Tax=Pleomorphochaeta sp. DL1XJH-081 TaxID=3409690 RepID=UPI003BB7AF47